MKIDMFTPQTKQPIKYEEGFDDYLLPLITHPLAEQPERKDPVSESLVRKPYRANPCERLSKDIQSFIATSVKEIMDLENPSSSNYWPTMGEYKRETLRDYIDGPCYIWLENNSSLGRVKK